MAVIAVDVLYFSTIRDVSSGDRIICYMYYLSTGFCLMLALLVVCELVICEDATAALSVSSYE